MFPVAVKASFGSLPWRSTECQSGSVGQEETIHLSISSTLGKANDWMQAGGEKSLEQEFCTRGSKQHGGDDGIEGPRKPPNP